MGWGASLVVVGGPELRECGCVVRLPGPYCRARELDPSPAPMPPDNSVSVNGAGHPMLFTTQYPRAIPPVIRANIDLWVLFKFASKERLLDQIYDEISSLLSIDKFEELYDYATKESKHDALIIDNHNRVNKDFMFRKNWNTVLKIT